MKVGVLAALASAGAIGVAAANSDWGLGATLLVPALSYAQPSRTTAYAVAVVYYAAASYLLITAAVAFFGPHTTPLLSVLLWVTSSLLLASPYALLWNSCRSVAMWRIPLAIVMSVLPPLGLIGWASPLTAAGVLFPCTHWLGLLAALIIPAVLLVSPESGAAVTLTAVMMAHLVAPAPRPQPSGWEAVVLSVPGRTWTVAEEYAIAKRIQEHALASQARVIVFPESVVPMWSEATETLWRPTFEALRLRGSIVLFGTALSIGETGSFRNVVLARGAINLELDQHVPVPIGMWRPFEASGVPLNLTTPSTVTVGGMLIAPIICYENLLVAPVLAAMIHGPDVLVGFSNTAWERDGRILVAQHRLLSTWSRLFNVPAVFTAARP